jgi:hypothetical protein
MPQHLQHLHIPSLFPTTRCLVQVQEDVHTTGSCSRTRRVEGRKLQCTSHTLCLAMACGIFAIASCISFILREEAICSTWILMCSLCSQAGTALHACMLAVFSFTGNAPVSPLLVLDLFGFLASLISSRPRWRFRGTRHNVLVGPRPVVEGSLCLQFTTKAADYTVYHAKSTLQWHYA